MKLTEWQEKVLRHGPTVKITGWAEQAAQDAVAQLVDLGMIRPTGELCEYEQTDAGYRWIVQNTEWTS